VDSHCHLNLLDPRTYDGKPELAIAAAEKEGVGHMLCVCVDLETFPQVLSIAERYPNVAATLGLHPNEKVSSEPSVNDLLALAKHPKVVGIGETGLDYFRTEADAIDGQQQRFRTHIQVAKTLAKPLIIHTRMARADTIRIMREEEAQEVSGVMHCFTEDWEMAQQALDLNFYISFSGIVTFKNAIELQDVAKKVPLDRMLIETDSPYLAPVPHRGKPNEPAFVRYVAEFIAELRGISYAEIAEQTTTNFFNLFKTFNRSAV
jgi:TatD DNase family protein